MFNLLLDFGMTHQTTLSLTSLVIMLLMYYYVRPFECTTTKIDNTINWTNCFFTVLVQVYLWFTNISPINAILCVSGAIMTILIMLIANILFLLAIQKPRQEAKKLGCSCNYRHYRLTHEDNQND